MPFLTSEAAKYVKLSSSYAVTHPSLPNYMTLTGGGKFFSTDCSVTMNSCRVSARNLVDQLEAVHLSWKAYMETMPSPCYKKDSAGSLPKAYAARHDPFMHYDDIWSRTSRCDRVLPLTQLSTDLSNHALPSFAFISPNLCDDAHSCSLATADWFLKTWVPRIEWHLGTTGVIFVTFDEGTTNAGCCGGQASGGHIYTAILGPGAKLKTSISATVDAYSLLGAIEANWGLPLLQKVATAPTLQGWRS